MTFVVRVAWRNLWRHARRSLITAFAMAVGVALCMALFAFDDGIYDQMFHVMVERTLGHVQIHHPDYPSSKAMFSAIPDGGAVFAKVEALPGTKAAAPRLYGFALVGGANTASGAQVTGIDPVREAAVSPLATKIRTGRYLSDAPAGEVLLGQLLAAEIGAVLGEAVVVVTQAADGSTGNELYTVVGTYRTGSRMADGGAVLHLEDLRTLLVMGDRLHEVTLLAEREGDDDILALADAARGAVGPSLSVQTWWEAAPATRQMLDIRSSASFVLLGIVFSVAALGVLNTMMMSVFERTQELGVLLALGLRPMRMVALVLVESVFLASVACGIGLLLGAGLDLYLVVYGIDFSSAISSLDFGGFQFEPVFRGVVKADGIVQIVVAVFLVSVVASVWPAVRAARLRPVEAIRSE